jgi:hypothetical protein
LKFSMSRWEPQLGAQCGQRISIISILVLEVLHWWFHEAISFELLKLILNENDSLFYKFSQYFINWANTANRLFNETILVT